MAVVLKTTALLGPPVIEPGEKHWHGAAPGSAGTHLAVNLNSTTEWLEAVSDGPLV